MAYSLPWPAYTFIAFLILLISLAGAKVLLSLTLFRRTYVPPTPPAFVDLSKKPELWEAYLGDGGWQLGRSIGNESGQKGLNINTSWKYEHSSD